MKNIGPKDHLQNCFLFGFDRFDKLDKIYSYNLKERCNY